MNNELLLLIKKHTDTLIEQTKTSPQETFEFKMKKHMETFSLVRQKTKLKKRIWLPALTSFEATSSVFNITHENNVFSITTQGHWSSGGGAETI